MSTIQTVTDSLPEEAPQAEMNPILADILEEEDPDTVPWVKG